jgi:hypothetical protein
MVPFISAVWVALSLPVCADDTPVDLELIIAVDSSPSMDADEQVVQRQGYASAFRDPDLVLAITAGWRRRVAVAFIEWSGPTDQRVVVPWTLIDGTESAATFALGLGAPVQGDAQGTSISAALIFAADLFTGNGYAGDRQVIDISGDGVNNQGPPIKLARDRVLEQGIVINGLPIVIMGPGRHRASDPNVEAYYHDCVIGGPGAFSMTVSKVGDFASAIRQKLQREIALLPAQLLQADDRRAAGVDCRNTMPRHLRDH